MWVLIDNYDSFTWILRDYLLQTGYDCHVYRNDEISIAQLEALQPERLILSPGPETPAQAGITMAAIHQFHNRIPILGVCLGHQALGMYFGASLVRAPQPMHGKTSTVIHNGSGIFAHLPQQINVMRYHSLVLEEPLPRALQVTCRTDDGTIMALQHNSHPCTGVQFHPGKCGYTTWHGYAAQLGAHVPLIHISLYFGSTSAMKHTAANRAMPGNTYPSFGCCYRLLPVSSATSIYL